MSKKEEKALVKIEDLQKDYPAGKFNLLVPTTTIQQISPFHSPTIEVVQVNSDPKAGEIYKVAGTQKYALGKTPLMRIYYAAGIKVDPNHSRIVSNSRDYCCYEVLGGIQKSDGAWVAFRATKEWDAEIRKEQLTREVEKKAKTQIANGYLKEEDEKAYIENYVRDNLLRERANKLSLCETKALERLVRGILGMKGAYTLEEIKKPFVIPRISFSPDYGDPKIKQFLLQSAAMATASIYGSGPVAKGQAGAMPPVIEIPAPQNGDREPEEVIDVSKEKTQEEKDRSRIHILKNERECSESLYRKKLKLMGAVDEEGKSTSKALAEGKRGEFIAWLEELPEKEEEEASAAPTKEEKAGAMKKIHDALNVQIEFGTKKGETLGQIRAKETSAGFRSYIDMLCSERFKTGDNPNRVALKEAAQKIRWALNEKLLPPVEEE